MAMTGPGRRRALSVDGGNTAGELEAVSGREKIDGWVSHCRSTPSLRRKIRRTAKAAHATTLPGAMLAGIAVAARVWPGPLDAARTLATRLAEAAGSAGHVALRAHRRAVQKLIEVRRFGMPDLRTSRMALDRTPIPSDGNGHLPLRCTKQPQHRTPWRNGAAGEPRVGRRSGHVAGFTVSQPAAVGASARHPSRPGDAPRALPSVTSARPDAVIGQGEEAALAGIKPRPRCCA